MKEAWMKKKRVGREKNKESKERKKMGEGKRRVREERDPRR